MEGGDGHDVVASGMARARFRHGAWRRIGDGRRALCRRPAADGRCGAAQLPGHRPVPGAVHRAGRVLPAILLRHGPGGDAVQPGAARLDLPRGRRARQHHRLRLDPRHQRAGHDHLHECGVSAARAAIREDRAAGDRSLRAGALRGAFVFQHLGHELRRDLAPGGAGAEPWRESGRDLDEHRRGRSVAVSPRGRLRHRLSDRHRQIRGARAGRVSVGREACRGGRAPGGEDVRDQAEPGGETGQRGDSARRRKSQRRSPRSAASPWEKRARVRTGTRRSTIGAICST
jgi:hypothetical protein